MVAGDLGLVMLVTEVWAVWIYLLHCAAAGSVTTSDLAPRLILISGMMVSTANDRHHTDPVTLPDV
jgi:xanthine/uracil/vitamin C permease (AzgA family)